MLGGVLAGCSGSNLDEVERAALAATSGANLKATIVQQGSGWGSGYCAAVNITNLGNVEASSWVVVLEVNDASVFTTWNGNFTGSGSRKTATPVGWNAKVAVGATLQAFAYCANLTGTNHTPLVISPTGNTGSGEATGAGGSVASGGSIASGGSVANGGSSAVAGAAGVAGTAGIAGYVPTNDYRVNADHAVNTLKALADFRAKSRDNANGGFFTFVKRDGTVGSDRRKGFVTTTRDAWTFSRAFIVTGDDIYLDHAAHALEHLFSHAWGSINGGWYSTGDE